MAPDYRLYFSRLGWRGQIGLVLTVALGVAAAVALVIVSIGLALVLIPVVAIALLIGRWRLNKAMTAAAQAYEQRRRETSGRVIEADYAVVDDKRD
jgi:hypothetical protein